MRVNRRTSAHLFALATTLAAPAVWSDDLPGQTSTNGSGFVTTNQPAQPVVTGSSTTGATPVGTTPVGTAPGGTVPMQSQGQRYAQARRGLMLNAQLGAGLALSGTLATGAGYGPYGMIVMGWEIPSGLSGFVEVGGRYHSGSVSGHGFPAVNVSYCDFPLGVGARWTPLREVMIHPFVEGVIDLHFISATLPGNEFSRISATFGVAATLGAELDLAENFSLELGVRAEYILSAGAWNRFFPLDRDVGQNDFLITPFLGGTYYY